MALLYSTVDDVERLMAHFAVNSTTRPNKVQVESILADTEQEVTVALSGAGISTPVTTPTGFKDWVGLVVSYGATAAVLKSMFPSVSGPAETPAYAFWESRYKAALKGLADGSLISPDVPRNGHKIRPSNYFTRNPSEDEDLGFAEPWFGRRMPT